MRIALALLAAILLAPAALAHVETFSQSTSLVAGPYLVFLDPRPQPAFSNTTVSIVAQVSSSATGGLVTNVPANVTLTPPGGAPVEKKMESDGTGYLVSPFTLAGPGNYTVSIALHDGAGAPHTASMSFDVYPDIPYRIRAVDQAVDVITDQSTPLAFEIVDARTLERTDALTDLRVNLEHWADDHSHKIRDNEMDATRVTSGVWRIVPVFKEAGMYHMRFASQAGGFNYAEVPILHVYATPSDRTSVDDQETPFAPAALLALALGIALTLAPRRR